VSISSVIAEKTGRENIHIIPNGVDVKKFRNANGEKVRKELGLEGKVVGYVALFAEFTGLDRLIEASELLDGDITYLIVGDGPMVAPAKKYIEKKGIKNFIFTGFVSPDVVADYYQAIDVGVYPCDKTGFTDAASPIKVIEYTAAGKPVVCTDLEETKRMDFSNVVLVKDNPKSLAEGIEKAMTSKLEIPKKIEEYDIDRLAEKYEEILEC
jgi:glycosyltransferase involved in cell wall biosynthesis